jgi:hypothetical protein
MTCPMVGYVPCFLAEKCVLRSMIGVGLCLRNASVSTGERRGPVVRAVFRGSCHNKTLTRGLENIQVLDEIVQVRGRDVSHVRDT